MKCHFWDGVIKGGDFCLACILCLSLLLFTYLLWKLPYCELPTAGEELRPPVRQAARNWLLPTTMEVSWEQGSSCSSLERIAALWHISWILVTDTEPEDSAKSHLDSWPSKLWPNVCYFSPLNLDNLLCSNTWLTLRHILVVEVRCLSNIYFKNFRASLRPGSGRRLERFSVPR